MDIVKLNTVFEYYLFPGATAQNGRIKITPKKSNVVPTFKYLKKNYFFIIGILWCKIFFKLIQKNQKILMTTKLI